MSSDSKSNSTLKIKIKDQDVRDIPSGVTLKDFLKEIDGRLASQSLIARLNDKTIDLNTVLDESGQVELLENLGGPQ